MNRTFTVVALAGVVMIQVSLICLDSQIWIRLVQDDQRIQAIPCNSIADASQRLMDAGLQLSHQGLSFVLDTHNPCDTTCSLSRLHCLFRRARIQTELPVSAAKREKILAKIQQLAPAKRMRAQGYEPADSSGPASDKG